MGLIAITVLLSNTKGLKFYCMLDNSKCVIEDWNPSMDGYFLFQHIPNDTTSIHFINLQSLHIVSELCTILARCVDSLIIEHSPKVTMLHLPSTCNILVVTLQDTGLQFLNFEQNESLASVIVKNSRIGIIPATIANLPNIEYVTLDNTDVEVVDLHLFYPFRHLKLLQIRYAKVRYVRGTSATIGRCPLDSLKLDHNFLRIVNLNLFAPFASLTMLNLAYNRIEVLTGRLSNPILNSLLLNSNRLKVLDLCPWNVLHHLNAFTIAYNNIQRMPLCLHRFRNVTHASMQFNQINSIEVEQLIHLSNLVSINVSFNNISSIPVNESLYPPKLRQIDLCGNPISNDTITDRMIGSIDVML
ncbi:leucine-rich repeat and death domain-containing protein 1-like [Anopheles maculipalpis]|uniref:leucine-rich repeat and death domain-containing protein 1-like n=1 Tax=Anopheles maculipalpis TaxID=1496333 RepID=UPI002158B56F|nr:leucine-rich repeat and death domain-containing protein 1-like [Anopheles maculipalpis]